MSKSFIAAAMVLVAAACTRETARETKQEVKTVAKKVADDVATPFGRRNDAVNQQEREKERFDQQWRALQSFQAQQAAAAAAQQAAAQQAKAAEEAKINFVSGQKEKFKGLDANAINAAPVNVPITGDIRGPSVLKAQVFLDRNHFSVGALDGRWGRNSAISTWWWQRTHGLPATGDVDEATFRSLAQGGGNVPAVVQYHITADDTKGPFVNIPDDVYEQQKLNCLCYESLREELSEKFHCTEDFLEVLNPHVKFSELKEGDAIWVPNVRPPWTQDTHDIAKIVISLAGNSYSGFNAAGQLVFHAPTTVGNAYDPSPDETVKLVKIVPNPHFHYDPTLYHEVPDTDPDAHLSPGPNSPVGVVWMALSKPHYGMHGTKDPDSIGYASSHGCIRLCNWDAEELEHRVSEGIAVSFVDVTQRGLPDVAKKD
ncbi:MAG TPA: L,D-transpeptidase [Thermoanaerobaculia bacterium]|nr:L,D-transpeptidase [Thermoanaerobaculia bacterium]